MAVQYKDYYQILGVPRTASEADIKKSFRKLAREFHPDVARDKKKAEEKFKEINEAYEVLGDPAKRKKYDELGANWKSGAEFRPPPGPGGFGGARGTRGGPASSADFEFGGTGFSSFFEQLFGSRMREGGGGFGGRGGFSSAEAVERGNDIEGDIMVSLEEATRGSVRTVNVRHDDRNEAHQVRIPAGVGEGQKLRLSGRGERGAGGGPSGDLYLNVRFARHPDFDVSGWVNIKIPAGAPSGQKLRVRGRGLVRREGGHGDLFVVTRIVFPEKVTEAQKKLWAQLAQDSDFQPRS
jgi:curved DNA-binding protein